jgi:hypothetical protein
MLYWRKTGAKPPPPHSLKQKIIREYGEHFGLKVFFETGTYRGDMVAALLNSFEEIYSIEIFEPNYNKAASEFVPYHHVHILLGDSAEVMPKILPHLNKPVLFWLDGHYSGEGTGRSEQETPIVNELYHIFQMVKERNVILIDDARMFTGMDGYPTINEVRTMAFENGYTDFEVLDDIIRISKPQ